jgi:hypothetical protein
LSILKCNTVRYSLELVGKTAWVGIKMNFKETGYQDVKWIGMSQDRICVRHLWFSHKDISGTP